jgi:signal transduction histidine kinase
VQVEAEARPGWVHIRVTDQGRGIPPSELERIFDLFYQSDRSRHEQQGIGAGLPIANEIARMHGGTLSAASRLGAGSTFTLSLPAAG